MSVYELFCTSYILSTKICVLRAKGGHFWEVRRFWLVVKGLQVDVRVRGLVGLIRVRKLGKVLCL